MSNIFGFQKTISHTIIIDSSKQQIWKALSNFSSYNKWNSLVPMASGHLLAGEKLKIQVSLPLSEPMNYQVIIVEVKENEHIEWLGHFKLPGLFDGLHSYRLSTISGNKTELIHEERFRGLLVPFVWWSLGPKFNARFSESNERLKHFVESEVI
jgi:hypothetical protein